MEVKCPRCGKVEEITLDMVAKAKPSGGEFKILVIPHGDHSLRVYFDANYKIRAVLVGAPEEAMPSGAVKNEENMAVKYSLIPCAVDGVPPSLSVDEQRVLELCDGKRSLDEIAAMLGLPRGRVNLLLQNLRRRGIVRFRQVVEL